MIEPEEIDAVAEEMGVHQANVERDYVFGWLLKVFFENDYLAQRLIFKGGNCMRKAFYLETRFSGDLDFSVQSAMDVERFQAEINKACADAQSQCGVKFDVGRNSFRADQMLDKERQSFKGRVYFEDFYGDDNELIISIRLDVTEFDRIYLPLTSRALIHP